MRRWRTEALASAVLAVAFVLLIGAAAPLRAEEPLARSFSAAGLARVSAFLRGEVASGRIPGAILLIQQHGKPVLSENFGLRNAKAAQPITDDTIFRLYSMSKPITSVAATMLVDDGKLALDDVVAKYVPAFAEVQVGVPQADGKLAPQPLARQITVRDLLRHTSGITYGFYGDSPVRKLYAQGGLFEGDPDNAQFVARLARLPLA